MSKRAEAKRLPAGFPAEAGRSRGMLKRAEAKQEMPKRLPAEAAAPQENAEAGRNDNEGFPKHEN